MLESMAHKILYSANYSKHGNPERVVYLWDGSQMQDQRKNEQSLLFQQVKRQVVFF